MALEHYFYFGTMVITIGTHHWNITIGTPLNFFLFFYILHLSQNHLHCVTALLLSRRTLNDTIQWAILGIALEHCSAFVFSTQTPLFFLLFLRRWRRFT